MQTITIKNRNTGAIIFKGLYNNNKECIEDAISKRINLENADLRHTNLQCVNIDTAQLNGADLRFCNLNYANISESNLSGADLRGASLIGTCLAEANLTNSNMRDACFGATDIGYAILDGAQFSTLSALALPFTEANSMQLCVFHSVHQQKFTFSEPPIMIQGLFKENIYLIEKNALIGHTLLPLSIQDIIKNMGIIFPMQPNKHAKFDIPLQKEYVKHNN